MYIHERENGYNFVWDNDSLYDKYDKEVGLLRTSTYAKLVDCSTDTTLRDLQDLVEKEILKSEDSGKKTNYLIISPKNIRIPKLSTTE